MVEGARLESVYRGNSIEGSNPSLSASVKSISYESLSPPGWQPPGWQRAIACNGARMNRAQNGTHAVPGGTARNTKAGMPKTPVLENLMRDGVVGKSAGASSTSPGP